MRSIKRAVAETMFLALVLSSGATPAVASGPFTAHDAHPPDGSSPGLPGHLRILDPRLADAVARGAQHSATLRRLIDRIGELDGIVYVIAAVQVRPGTNHVLLAALSHHVTVAGSTRILRITVGHNYGDRAVTTIAHELRHATEVLQDPAVRTGADVTALFERIGYKVYAGVLETKAAQESERTVAQELRASRSREP